jgi:hypothetical protein
METIELIIQLSKLVGGLIIIYFLYRINEGIHRK